MVIIGVMLLFVNRRILGGILVMSYTRFMAKLWLKLAVGCWLLAFGWRVWEASRLPKTVGEIHWMIDNQRLYNRVGFQGSLGRLVANKWLVGFDKAVIKSTESVDPNILFFVGHPNERVGMKEQRYLPWWLLPIWIMGLVTISKFEAGLWLLASAAANTYLMAAFYGWLVIKGVKHLWRRK